MTDRRWDNDSMSLAEQILRKLLVPEKAYEQHYVDLEMGVFDCRVDLTDEEIDYCRAMRLTAGLGGAE